MPPEGDTTVTINDEVTAKLARVMARHDVESMSFAIEHAAQFALDEEAMTNTGLARLLYHRLRTEEGQ
jgi:hypothetical protein